MFDRAVQFTERIVQKWPSDPDVHLDAGVCYLYYGGVPTRACTEFRESLRLRPNNQAALGHLSVAEMSVRLGMDPKELRAPDAS
jgi:Flp pilus assembly protein TadD